MTPLIVAIVVVLVLQFFFYFTDQKFVNSKGETVVVLPRYVHAASQEDLATNRWGDDGVGIVLRSRFFSKQVTLRTLICVIPVWASIPGTRLEGLELWVSICVTLLVDRVIAPSPRFEITARTFIQFSGLWLTSELFRLIQFSWIIGIATIGGWLWLKGGMPAISAQDALDAMAGVEGPGVGANRIAGSYDFPLILYLLWLIVGTFRATAVGLSFPRGSLFIIPFVYLVWIQALISIHLLMGQVVFTEDSWEAPFGGFVVAQLYRLITSYLWARIDG